MTYRTNAVADMATAMICRFNPFFIKIKILSIVRSRAAER